MKMWICPQKALEMTTKKEHVSKLLKGKSDVSNGNVEGVPDMERETTKWPLKLWKRLLKK